MATLNFYRSRPNEKVSGIYFRLNYGAFEMVNGKKVYRPFKYYIDESIDKDNWNNGKARARKEFPQHIEFNQKLRGTVVSKEPVSLKTYRLYLLLPGLLMGILPNIF